MAVTRFPRGYLKNGLMGLMIFVAPVVWILLQQGVGVVSYLHCQAAKPPWGALIGASATLACTVVAGRCWLSRKQGAETQRFLVLVSAGSAAIFALAALTMTVALLLVPACAR